MLLKYFYDKKLAHASYMVGCQRAQVAIIVDPGRDIDQYLETAAAEGLKITAVAETHIHADYVSGARELADRVGAKLYVSDEVPAEWKYLYLDEYESELLHDGDRFMVGNIKFDVMHTPGHTPESISFVLTDQGGGADEPMGIFTGDFVFVGSIGRPDLLEEAAGIENTAEPGARDLFKSIARFRELADHLQVWPAHGAGSACGKGLGAIPSSTVGYEKRFNPALQFTSEDEFVQYILADQPDAPKYFAVMKHVNKAGPELLGQDAVCSVMAAGQIEKAISDGQVIDIRPAAEYAQSHVPGTWNIPTSMLAAWAGWLLDYDKPVYLIAENSCCRDNDCAEAVRVLHKIGIDSIAGVFRTSEVVEAGLASESYEQATPQELKHSIASGDQRLIDVRSAAEWKEGHIPQAEHRFLGRLPQALSKLPKDKPIAVQCRSGARSAIAASVLQASGFQVTNMQGGYQAWLAANLPVKASDGCDSDLGVECTA